MITHVAIWRDDIIYALPKPNRHHNILQLMPKEDKYTDGNWDIQGFLATGLVSQVSYYEHGVLDRFYGPYGLIDQSKLIFLGRKEAFLYAKRLKQLKRNTDPKLYQGNELFSEDLW